MRRSRTRVAPSPPSRIGAGAKASTFFAERPVESQSGSASRRTASPPADRCPRPCITRTQRSPLWRALAMRSASRRAAGSRRRPCRSIRSSGSGSPRSSACSRASLTPCEAARNRSSGSGHRKALSCEPLRRGVRIVFRRTGSMRSGPWVRGRVVPMRSANPFESSSSLPAIKAGPARPPVPSAPSRRRGASWPCGSNRRGRGRGASRARAIDGRRRVRAAPAPP